MMPRNYSERNQKFVRILQNRAWLLHSMYSFARAFNWAYGKSAWRDNECIDDVEGLTDCPKYNRELLDPITPTVRIITKITIILGVLLNLSIIKYRNLANLILYFESIASTIYVLIPTKEYLEFTGFFFMVS